MYLLEKFHLVQFFLFRAETLSFSPATGIVAPNGSGKSAILDAMQIVLYGGDQNQIDLNAQSGGYQALEGVQCANTASATIAVTSIFVRMRRPI